MVIGAARLGAVRSVQPLGAARRRGALAAARLGAVLLACALGAASQSDAPREDDIYRVVDVPLPDDVVLEVGGLCPLPDGGLLVCTRRGEIWHLADAYADADPAVAARGGELPAPDTHGDVPDSVAHATLWADGLQEPLGLLAHEGWIYAVQRGELTRLRDADGDGRADVFETVCDAWRLSGSYHEYAFGPALDGGGRFWVTLNKPFDAEPFGRVDWRGWAVRIAPDGTMEPLVAGLRSPAGVAASPWGDVFYTDNQGEWCGASKLARLRAGDFHGHPHGLDSCADPRARVAHPGDVPDGMLMPVAARRVPGFVLPAVWFPYDVMGRSPSGLVWDTTGGGFGPFAGQVLVGDQYQASVMRVFLEQVDGVWQGACFPFRAGLASGVIRLAFGTDDSLFVGMSDRGWPSLGTREWGLQRLVWTGVVPFEIQELRALPDGLLLVFTEPVDPATAGDPARYALARHTYRLHSDYGSDEMDAWTLDVDETRLRADGRSVELRVRGLREGYVHALVLDGVRAADGRALLHDRAYATLVARPGGPRAPRAALLGEVGAASALDARLRAQGWDVDVLDAGDAGDAWHDVLRDADVLVLLPDGGDVGPERAALLDRFARSGRGVVALGVAGLAGALRELVLGDAQVGALGDRRLRPCGDHPVLAGAGDLAVSAAPIAWAPDDADAVALLASGDDVYAWAHEYEGVRVVTAALGGRAEGAADPAVAALVASAAVWVRD